MVLCLSQAENLVLTLRDLFQTVYELKKQEIEDAKAKAAAGTEGEGENVSTALVNVLVDSHCRCESFPTSWWFYSHTAVEGSVKFDSYVTFH